MFDEKMKSNLKKLNDVSPCFCLAKWLQVTIDLVQGQNHSCHHPKRHQIPLDELAKNPAALHDTQFKKEQRRKMLTGERPKECSYCWDMEDLGNNYSDRFIKSTDPWSWEKLEKIKNLPWDSNVKPTYVEVMLDDTCNFSCAYCSTSISSSIKAEFNQFGRYPGFTGFHHRQSLDNNEPTEVYREAFFKWLPTILDELQVIRLTGGEPLLSRHFWNFLKLLKTLPSENLNLVVNSHMSHGEALLNRFISELKELKVLNKFKKFDLYVSLDTQGEQAEYIRAGLQYEKMLRNLNRINSEIPGTEIVVMCTFNILSIARFSHFLDDMIKLKKEMPLTLDISYLRDPHYLRANNATDEMKIEMEESFDYMKKNSEFFNIHEINKFSNVLNWVKAEQNDSNLLGGRADFFRFTKEYDKRKKKDLYKTFPEYADFFKVCKIAALDKVIKENDVTKPAAPSP